MATIRHQEHSSQPSSVVLRKRAQQLLEENAKEAKRYKEEQRLDAVKEKDKKITESIAEAKRLEEKRKELAQVLVNKKFEVEQQQAKVRAKTYRCWLQTMYPAVLADRCIQMYTVEMKPDLKRSFQQRVHRHLQAGLFKRHLFIHKLWDWDKNLTQHWGSTKAFHGGGQVRSIHCAPHFANIIDSHAPQPRGTANPAQMLQTLLEQCVPYASKIFCGNYGALKLLHMNDYIIEKTFVYAIYCLSKWLGKDIFSWGIGASWPLAPPPDLYASDPDVLHVPDADEMSYQQLAPTAA